MSAHQTRAAPLSIPVVSAGDADTGSAKARSNSDARSMVEGRSSSVLQRGDEGREVKLLQDELQWADFLSESDKGSGWGTFGPRTEAAVIAFQGQTGLAPSGTVDGTTRRALREFVAAQNATTFLPPPIEKGAEGGQVRRMQKALVTLGFLSQESYERHPGEYSGQTERGVKRLQAAAKLKETGAMDAETWQALIDRAGPEVTGQDPDEGRVLTGDPVLKEGSEGPAVKELERVLAGYGASLSPDKVYDEETTAAVKEFQKTNGLVVDGRVGVATAAALGSGSAKARAEATPVTGGSGPEWLLQFLLAQGLEGDQLRLVWTIGMRESNATSNLTTHGGQEDWDNAGPSYYDVGLFQINNRNLSTVRDVYGEGADMELMLDPAKNYTVAKRMADGWTNFLPWGLNPDGTFNWSYYEQDWLDRYQSSSEAHFKQYFRDFERYAREAGVS